MEDFHLPFSGKISDETLYDMDDDAMMFRIREITKKKEQLMEEVEDKTMEVNFWEEVLQCSSSSELESLVASNPSFCTPLTPTQQSTLIQYHNLVSKIQSLRFLESTSAHPTEDGDILVKFLRPSKLQFCSTRMVLLTPGDNETFSVRHHNLPKVVPVNKLEEQYLKKSFVNESDPYVGLKKFVTWLTQYVRPLYSRQDQIYAYQEGVCKFGLYYNKACTSINFIFGFKENNDQDIFQYEVLLEYDPRDILPSKVSINYIGESAVSEVLQEAIEVVRLNLYEDPFPEVMFAALKCDVSPGTESFEDEESEDTDKSEMLFGFV